MTTKTPSAPNSNVGLLRSLKPTARAILLRYLPASLQQEVLDEWTFWCRPEQLAPASDWRCWVFLGGRGAGKTRAGAEWVSGLVRSGGAGRIALIGPTFHDVREVMIEGNSGLRTLSRERPVYEASRKRLVWRNGAQAACLSAEDPDALRGPQFDAAWCDDRAGLAGVDAGALRGAVSGYVVDSPATARDALEPLLAAFDFSAREHNGHLVFAHTGAAVQALDVDALTAASSALAYAQRDASEAPVEARVRFIDAGRDYLLAGVSARRLDRAEGGVATIAAPLVLEAAAAETIAQRILADRRAATETLGLAMGPSELKLEAGDRVAFRDDIFEIVRIEDADARHLELRRARSASAAILSGVEPNQPPAPQHAPTPAFSILDLPPVPNAETDELPLAAVFAAPWRGTHEIYAGAAPSLRASVAAPAIMGELLWPLWPGAVDRWDEGNVVRVSLYGGALASVTRDEVLNGANAFAVESGGEWEIIQAAQCELVEPGVYQLRTFLRGRQARRMGCARRIRLARASSNWTSASCARPSRRTSGKRRLPLSLRPPARCPPAIAPNAPTSCSLMRPRGLGRPHTSAPYATRPATSKSAGCAAPGLAATLGARASRRWASRLKATSWRFWMAALRSEPKRLPSPALATVRLPKRRISALCPDRCTSVSHKRAKAAPQA